MATLLGHRLGGNTSGDRGVALDEESVMTRLYIGRIGWPAGVVLLSAVLLLATRIDIPTRIVRESAVSGRLAALVTAADDPSSTPASVPDATTPDCETSGPDPLRSAWMTAC
jgi:hypothetical protein